MPCGSNEVSILRRFETIGCEINSRIQRALVLDVHSIRGDVVGVETTLVGGVVPQDWNIRRGDGGVDVWDSGACVGEVEGVAVWGEGDAVGGYGGVFNDANVAGRGVVAVGGCLELGSFRVGKDVAREF